jgi:hypothetical protein
LFDGACFIDGFSNPHGFGVILKNFLHNLRAKPDGFVESLSTVIPAKEAVPQ